MEPLHGSVGDSVPQDTPEQIENELLYLRKRAGFGRERLAGLGALVRLLGGPDEPADMLAERFESAVRSLHDADSDLLLGVYGLADDTRGVPLLGQRRDIVGRGLGVGRDAVADREADAIQRLRTQLISGWYPKSPIPLWAAEPHGSVVLYSVATRLFLNNLRFQESWHLHRYVAIFDGAEYIQIDTTTYEPLQVSGGYQVEEESISGGRALRFYPPQPLTRGRTYELRYRISKHADRDDPHVVEGNYLAFHEPVRSATFETVFRGERPTWVWWFKGLTHLATPRAPYRQTLLSPRDDDGLVGVRLDDLYGGLFSGLAWE